MKIRSATFALLSLILPAAFAADPEDLYTRVGTDPTPAELLAAGTIVWGESSSTNTVTGSQIIVDHALLDQETGVLGPFSPISGVHIPISGRRTDYANITRWYQQDGNTQIFRLFQGENNYRYDVPQDAPPSRVESVSPTLTVASGTWREWEGTYTIIDPLSSAIFQLFHEGSDLWSFHLGMSGSGDISFDRRNSIPGLPDQITLATNMAGKSLSIKVRANGFNYELYSKIPLVDEDWNLVTIGSYQQSPTNKVIFRWGMYPGSQPGMTSKDGMLFVSGAATSISTAPPVTPPAPPVTYYWDNNGDAAGFGTTAGTWTEPTTGDATQGWSTDGTGASEPPAVTTSTSDSVNFGNGAAGLGAGTILVSGTVGCGNMSFASGSGATTVSGGIITLPATDTPTITVNNNVTGGNVINSVLAGQGSLLTVAGRYTLALNGLNTFNSKVIIGDNTNDLTVRINSIADVGGGASSLGSPSSAARGLIQIGSGSRSSTLEFLGASAAASTDRKVMIGSVANGSGSARILNNDIDPAHTLTFSNAAFNAAAIGPYSSTNRTLTLGGSNTGDNTVAGVIIDNGVSGVGVAKDGTGTWVLSGASSYTNVTNINAGTLKMGLDHALPNGPGTGNVNVNGGANASSSGTLDLNGHDLTIRGLGGGSGTFRGRVYNNATGTGKTLTVGSSDANGTFAGFIADNNSGTGTIAVTKIGTGTQTLSGPNTYTGGTTISGGTLATGETDVLPDNSAVSLGAATLDVGATFSDITGSLEVTDGATIKLGDADSKLAFADSSGVTWTGSLDLTGTFISGASLRFGTTSGGLTAAQLLLITVNGGSAPFALDKSGYLVTAPAPTTTTLFSDHFDGLGTDPLHGTTPDVTTAGATWVAMNTSDDYVRADGTMSVSGGNSGTRGGSATLAFTPQNGFIYTLDMSATGLDSAAANSQSPLLGFGFAKGQSSGTGLGNRLSPGDATVQGQVIQDYVTKSGYTGSARNASDNATSSMDWPVLDTSFGGDIDLRVVLDTSNPGNWTATWYAKKPDTSTYSLTRDTETVTDTGITSVGFGLNHLVTGSVSSFTLTAGSTTALIADHFNGIGTAELNGTTPDVTIGGAAWVAMNGGATGAVYADGTIDVSGGASADRGGSATVAFTPEDGYIYTLELAARDLNSTASHSTANRLYFGFADGQSSANGTANQLQVGSAAVTGKVTQGFMTKVGYTGANGIGNRTYSPTASDAEWLALTDAFGDGINLRIVLDTSATAWTATWYAKRPTTTDYVVTRATEVVADKVITSIGFGLATFTSGRVTGFSLVREAATVSAGYSSWAALNGAGVNLDGDHDADGVSNGVEYFIGGPGGNTTGFTPLPGVTDDAGTLSVTWTHAADYTGAYGTHFWVETSATLAAPWTMEKANPEAGFTVTFPTATEVRYTFPAGTENFARLKVTGP